MLAPTLAIVLLLGPDSSPLLIFAWIVTLFVAMCLWYIVRRAIRQLTGLEQTSAKRERHEAAEILARAADATPRLRCIDCKHWDKEEGQAIMASHRIFQAAAQVVSPAEMGRYNIRKNVRPCPECKGERYIPTGRFRLSRGPDGRGEEIMEQCTTCGGFGELSNDELSAPSAPYKAKWEDFGACVNPSPEVENEIRWAEDSCPHFEAKS